jgi:ribosomal protein S18 acetylase RimI-like enzyme
MMRRPEPLAGIRLAPPICSLVAIGVLASARMQGRGAALVEAFEEQARARGFGSLRLAVHRDNSCARRLYERTGWLSFSHPDPGLLHYGKCLKRVP